VYLDRLKIVLIVGELTYKLMPLALGEMIHEMVMFFLLLLKVITMLELKMVQKDFIEENPINN